MNSSGLDLSLSLSLELEADLLVKQYHKNRKINATAAATSLAIKKKIIDNNDNNNNVNDNKINSSSQSKGKINKKEKSILSLSQSPPRSGRDSRGGGKSPIQNQNNWNSSQSLKNDIPNGSQLRRSADDDALGTYVHSFLSFSVNFIIFYFRIR